MLSFLPLFGGYEVRQYETFAQRLHVTISSLRGARNPHPSPSRWMQGLRFLRAVRLEINPFGSLCKGFNIF